MYQTQFMILKEIKQINIIDEDSDVPFVSQYELRLCTVKYPIAKYNAKEKFKIQNNKEHLLAGRERGKFFKERKYRLVVNS